MFFVVTEALCSQIVLSNPFNQTWSIRVLWLIANHLIQGERCSLTFKLKSRGEVPRLPSFSLCCKEREIQLSVQCYGGTSN